MNSRYSRFSESPISLIIDFGCKFKAFVVPGIFILWLLLGCNIIPERSQGIKLRFGAYQGLVGPGFNWVLPGVSQIIVIDLASINSLRVQGIMLTSDENLVDVTFDIQYRRNDALTYYNGFEDRMDFLQSSAESIIRAVIADMDMDSILTDARDTAKSVSIRKLSDVVRQQDSGISIVDINFLVGKAPDFVKHSFDDVIASREDAERYVKEARSYENKIIPQAEAQVTRNINEASAYSKQIITKATGSVSGFVDLLPKYRLHPEIIMTQMYFDTMTYIYKNNEIVFTDNPHSNQLNHLDLNKIIKNETK
ncbi:FtsH protease activity modulator HflK (plasmid) [Aliivibrio salmonicida]|uniref:FtsH protease activity modulator HflK n=1 Tax=Aliivibrio salmonicida TaxID=40269 RepID=UPI000F716841|nr:FtsH protease activity modulator HflK [Aliivibrio salmonicida]AZL83359.1 FtsH protease activity modulator HflK [Aliivibrio salmonicida]